MLSTSKPNGEVTNDDARRVPARRAFSLLELIAVLTIVGLLSSMAFIRFGEGAYNTTSAQGFVRALVLDLRQARSRVISTGEDHYVLFSRTDGVVTSYTLYRDGLSGDYIVDRTVAVPKGAVVTTATDTWTFDFEGSLSGGTGTGTIVVTGPHHTWTINVYRATGAIKSTEVSS